MPSLPDEIDRDALLALSPSESTPLWLELCRSQAGRRRPAQLVGQLRDDPFVAPSPLDQRTVHRLDGLALEAAGEFQALHLSPVAPLGCCSVVAPTSQDRTLSAARGLEVVSDPTNVLALEAARRLARAPRETVRLCTVHQVLRAQAQPPIKGFTQHFRIFASGEAGRARADDAFEVAAVARALGVFDRIFDAAERQLGIVVPNRRATVFVAAGAETLAERVQHRLEQSYPHVRFAAEPFDAAYYQGIRVLFGGDGARGEHIPIADIGRFDWVATLTSNRRNRFVAAGLGLQLIPLVFGAVAPATEGAPS
ncbi:MAG: hypothetical protein MI919_01555 [Holophagales bacterium]|nr:hypothetical protein [Holophagales bacterium]